MVRWVVGSLDRWINGGPIALFLVPVLNNWWYVGRGVCYPDYGMVYLKDPLMLMGKSKSCSGGSECPLSLTGPLP